MGGMQGLEEEPMAAPMVVDEQESVPDMFGDSGDQTSVLRKTVTIRKRIVRKIIVLPDGSRKEVEEEVPVEDEEPSQSIDVTRRQVHRQYMPDPERQGMKQPKPVERLYVTRVIRKPD